MRHEMLASNDTSTNKSQVNLALYCEAEIQISENPTKC